jgi:hypothetical protein
MQRIAHSLARSSPIITLALWRIITLFAFRAMMIIDSVRIACPGMHDLDAAFWPSIAHSML